MPTSQSVRGIVNGHWEPSPPRPPVLTVVRTGVAKLLKKLSDSVEPAEKAPTEREHQDQVAAE